MRAEFTDSAFGFLQTTKAPTHLVAQSLKLGVQVTLRIATCEKAEQYLPDSTAQREYYTAYKGLSYRSTQVHSDNAN